MNTIKRREYQKKLQEKNTLQLGDQRDLPIPIDCLKNIENYPNLIKEHYKGLTAQVFHLEIEGKHYNLKRAHPSSKVNNDDGHLAFLNEILRRQDLMSKKEISNQTPKTIYASLKDGIMLSEWLQGSIMHTFNKSTFRSLYNLLFELEKIGLFEWDLCRGNLLEHDQTIYLFDFGYMYPFDMLEEYNPEGNLPIFHMIERFETRTLMPYLFDLEKTDKKEALKIYKESKEVAIEIYQKKISYLKDHNGQVKIIKHLDTLIKTWQSDCYIIDQCRSFILDIADDLSGKSCTKHTLKKIERMIFVIENDYGSLVENQLLFFDNCGLSKKELLEKYKIHYDEAVKFQINPS